MEEAAPPNTATIAKDDGDNQTVKAEVESSTKIVKAEEEDSDDEHRCVICLAKKLEDPAYADGCNKRHLFCFECLRKWFKQAAKCPSCRQPSTFICHKLQDDSFEVVQLADLRAEILNDEVALASQNESLIEEITILRVYIGYLNNALQSDYSTCLFFGKAPRSWLIDQLTAVRALSDSCRNRAISRSEVNANPAFRVAVYARFLDLRRSDVVPNGQHASYSRRFTTRMPAAQLREHYARMKEFLVREMPIWLSGERPQRPCDFDAIVDAAHRHDIQSPYFEKYLFKHTPHAFPHISFVSKFCAELFQFMSSGLSLSLYFANSKYTFNDAVESERRMRNIRDERSSRRTNDVNIEYIEIDGNDSGDDVIVIEPQEASSDESGDNLYNNPAVCLRSRPSTQPSFQLRLRPTALANRARTTSSIINLGDSDSEPQVVAETSTNTTSRRKRADNLFAQLSKRHKNAKKAPAAQADDHAPERPIGPELPPNLTRPPRTRSQSAAARKSCSSAANSQQPSESVSPAVPASDAASGSLQNLETLPSTSFIVVQNFSFDHYLVDVEPYTEANPPEPAAEPKVEIPSREVLKRMSYTVCCTPAEHSDDEDDAFSRDVRVCVARVQRALRNAKSSEQQLPSEDSAAAASASTPTSQQHPLSAPEQPETQDQQAVADTANADEPSAPKRPRIEYP